MIIFRAQLLFASFFLQAGQTIKAAIDVVCEEDGTCTHHRGVSSECRLVMAESTIRGGGWGIFTTVDRPRRGTPLLYGDLAIQVTDLNVTFAVAAQRLMHDYWWSAEETGGFYEGQNVMSSIPGIGMLANGLQGGGSNALPFVPMVDEGGLTRTESPGAGAISHYHNYTWFVKKPMTAGEEVFVDYGREWFLQHEDRIVRGGDIADKPSKRSVDWLLQHGYCLDSVQPGRSAMQNAGRGLFAARRIAAGVIVLPVPVIAIPDKRVLDIVREKQDGTKVSNLKQLLLNYCFGNKRSSVLLYPYGPGVHLVNHGGGKYANVRLEWDDFPANVTLAELVQWQNAMSTKSPKFLLKLVATKDIEKGQEILLDYGIDWVEAWVRHMESWVPSEDEYVPAYVMDDVANVLRTLSEVRTHAYPDNIFTSCFYRFSDNADIAGKDAAPDIVRTVQWKQNRGIFELSNLRPCTILERNEKDKTFTVQIRNRFGLPLNERISKVHIVTDVPRQAIRFSDKLYTTDQHLEGAFRHPIGVPDEVWPEPWKDPNLGGKSTTSTS